MFVEVGGKLKGLALFVALGGMLSSFMKELASDREPNPEIDLPRTESGEIDWTKLERETDIPF